MLLFMQYLAHLSESGVHWKKRTKQNLHTHHHRSSQFSFSSMNSLGSLHFAGSWNCAPPTLHILLLCPQIYKINLFVRQKHKLPYVKIFHWQFQLERKQPVRKYLSGQLMHENLVGSNHGTPSYQAIKCIKKVIEHIIYFYVFLCHAHCTAARLENKHLELVQFSAAPKL